MFYPPLHSQQNMHLFWSAKTAVEVDLLTCTHRVENESHWRNMNPEDTRTLLEGWELFLLEKEDGFWEK